MKDVSRKAAQLVAQHGNTLDMGRQLSMGPGGAKTLLDEGEKARPTSITITNDGTADRAIVFGVPRHSIFTSVTGTPDVAAFLEAVGADLVLTDGILETGAGDVTVVEATSNDSGRTIAQLMEHASHNPLRLTEMDIQSSNSTDGTPDSTAFTTSIKTVWVSPFQKPREETFPLRKLQTNRSNATQFGSINFIDRRFPVILSRENFLVVIVKKKTSLSLTLGVGMEDSSAQRLYRTVQKSDPVVSAVKAGAAVPESCGC